MQKPNSNRRPLWAKRDLPPSIVRLCAVKQEQNAI